MTDLREPYACIQIHLENLDIQEHELVIEIERLKAKHEAIGELKRNLIHALSEQKRRDTESNCPAFDDARDV